MPLPAGLIYRRYRPVHYSPSSRSALAEAELIYVDDHYSRSVYVTYESVLHGVSKRLREIVAANTRHLKVKLLVWTTTPWTLPTNMVRGRRTVIQVSHVITFQRFQGIAVHSELEYLLVRRHGTDDLLIVGCNRLPFLHHVIGDTTVLHSFKGKFVYSPRSLST